MKTQKRIYIIIVSIIVSLFTFSLSAAPLHNDTTTFKVYGNCEMCKKRIEKALLKNQNIKSVNWDVESKILTVVYNSHMTNIDAMHTIVADAGLDTDTLKATDKNYNKLPGCCQYDRKK